MEKLQNIAIVMNGDVGTSTRIMESKNIVYMCLIWIQMKKLFLQNASLNKVRVQIAYLAF